VFQKGLITAIPYVPAAIIMFFWSRDASKRGLKTWHIAIPRSRRRGQHPAGALRGLAGRDDRRDHRDRLRDLRGAPQLWTLPTRFLTGAAAAAGVALINTIGNLAGFSAPFITGAVHDWTGGYEVPMFIVGVVMLISAVLMILLARSNRINPVTVGEASGDEAAVAADGEGSRR
jgi:hypothetical protein